MQVNKTKKKHFLYCCKPESLLCGTKCIVIYNSDCQSLKGLVTVPVFGATIENLVAPRTRPGFETNSQVNQRNRGVYMRLLDLHPLTKIARAMELWGGGTFSHRNSGSF